MSKYDNFEIGKEYDRPTVATMLGFKDFHAIGRGMVTPTGENKILLFLTREQEPGLREYSNTLLDGIVSTDGETGHRNDQRMIRSTEAGDEIHVFFREAHRAPFIYHGTATLLDHEVRTSTPSKFRLTLDHHQSALDAELRTHGDLGAVGGEEGKRRLYQAIDYERDPKNRAAAIRMHGSICNACGFDFNEVYGVDHAKSYIEVHHVESITIGERKVDPATDLIPLCSNCHSMVHRKAGEIMPVAELKKLLGRGKNTERSPCCGSTWGHRQWRIPCVGHYGLVTSMRNESVQRARFIEQRTEFTPSCRRFSLGVANSDATII